MAKAKCYISNTQDPWFNLATEEWIFKDLNPEQHVLFLWRNDKSVIIGRNQNPWVECNLQKLKENKINLVRRQSGGGAVYQDLGNTCFTFLSSRKEYDRKRNYNIVINSLKKLGIVAEQTGRNDISINGCKVSGSAFKENSDKAFHHGTLMIKVNLSELEDYLTPSPRKLLSKGTTSVRKRVANIQDFQNKIDHDSLTSEIIEEFFKTYGAEKDIEVLDYNSLKNIPELYEYYKLLKSHSWVLGETPQFNHHLQEKFSWGLIDLHINSEKGKITDAKIFSDCLDTELIERLEKQIIGEEYNKESIKKKYEILKKEIPQLSDQIEEFSRWLADEL